MKFRTSFQIPREPSTGSEDDTTAALKPPTSHGMPLKWGSLRHKKSRAVITEEKAAEEEELGMMNGPIPEMPKRQQTAPLLGPETADTDAQQQQQKTPNNSSKKQAMQSFFRSTGTNLKATGANLKASANNATAKLPRGMTAHGARKSRVAKASQPQQQQQQQQQGSKRQSRQIQALDLSDDVLGKLIGPRKPSDVERTGSGLSLIHI